ncbi:type I glyceraldehyde-3-phosphate dehydrogenase [Helicobacter trogontum]|uniref:Glyceraldehyde-3-phosphate dehydrogenase n=1 Tax=Helicobacter trogontum TaxID=50960 RepID=A0A4U8THX6_9HELI|nr:type I glyceraldehyde-3-phosphate dehydrogenase [Helicobacter trogontum]MDY5185504.1 type I glyceraldehyde-3-phosphate dehydrogenase [Helicobacter trogontum]TLD99304.1 type I glyceraldehyde-3-phosphate dehydrogenase [Helicobacter trogontum]
MTLGINGLGRMGRTILREAIRRGHNIKALNDVAKWEILAYLIEFDSAHGTFHHDVSYHNNTLLINNQSIQVSNHSDPKDIDFGEVDVVVESSGKFLTTESVQHHLQKGAKKIIISAPPQDDTKMFVLGVNHMEYNGQSIISNASCTTNCIAPICAILDKHYGIISATMTTIHSYTNDQNLLDNAHRSDKRRSRAAANNIIPTTTGAAIGLKRVLPNLEGKIHGQSVRVPLIDVSMADLNFYLNKTAKLDEIHTLFESYASDSMKNILSIDSKYRVSSDFLGSTYSSIVAKDLSVQVGNMLKIMAWYDNESGYANRILDMAEFILR